MENCLQTPKMAALACEATGRVTGRFGHDTFRPEKTWTFRPKAWTIRPRMMNVSAKKMDVSAKYIFNSFTETNNTHYRKQSFTYVACRLLRWQQQAEWQKTGINFKEKSRQQYHHFGRNVHNYLFTHFTTGKPFFVV